MDILESVGPQLLVHDGQNIVKRSPGFYLKGKTVAFYFSAHWCPPCRQFTPQLAAVYRQLKARGVAFEIVFVSSDRSPSDQESYFRSMPWTAMPYEAARGDLGRALAQRFSLAGIPRLVVVGPDGAIVSGDARAAVAADPTGANFPWAGPASAVATGGWASNPVALMLLFLVAWLVSNWMTKGHPAPMQHVPS
ncbi:NRX4 [Auxenochlorella protothecoides x Auxenochlorella symbiontica]